MPSCRTILPINVDADPTDAVTTAPAGLLAYQEWGCVIGMPQHIDRHPGRARERKPAH